MTRLKLSIILILLSLLFTGPVEAGLYTDLVVNYSNFSYISSIAVGYQYVYFGTTHGITRYDKVNKRWADPLTSIDGFYDRRIYEVRVSFDEENLWVKTDFGNYEYSASIKQWRPINDFPPDESQVRHLDPDPFYFAPWGYNYMTSGYLVDDYAREFKITDIVDDNWANLWIGIWGLGAAWSDIESRHIKLLPFGPLYADITSLSVSDGVLWMGGLTDSAYRTGMTAYDLKKNEFDYIEFSDNNRFLRASVFDIYAGEEKIFAATDDGVWIIDRKEKKFVERLSRHAGIPDDQILCVFNFENYLLAGTEFGLGVVDLNFDSSGQVARVMMPSATVICLESSGRNIWIGTDDGIYRWNIDKNKLGRLTAGELNGFWVINDLVNTGGKMWVAGDNELASINLETAKIETYPEIGLYGGVRAVAVHDTLTAVATGSGLLLLFNGEKPHNQLFTVDDGLISNNVRDLLFEGDYIWLATDRGLTRFWYKNPAL
ncbi:MAG: hypothetical protein DRP46_00310 [Candidatus Zixiibacteriota bacterium]|nr:MAG: hypothetical protein DRP46_00310 [candidate division Zixibacteria bacterium]